MTTDRGEGPSPPLTVAVTGPTGDIGRSLLRALERNPRVGRVAAMARRPFHPEAEGLRKVEYRRADVLDAEAVRAVIDGADVVVHLAFMIMGGADETTRINLDGSRNVFGATLESALEKLRAGTGGSTTPPETTEPDPGTPDPGASTPPPTTGGSALDQALADAERAYTDGQEALRAGDFAAYGEAQQRLGEALDRARRAAGGQASATPSPSATPSATASSAASPSPASTVESR